MGKIGLSVSFCIKDIAMGVVNVNDVDKIISGTKCKHEDHWEEVIALYKEIYWRDFPKTAEKLVRQFITEKRIHQPRLENSRRYPILTEGWWTDNEDEIMWSTDF